MIDFKNEIMRKQEERTRGINEYNKVINENLKNIEELFEFKNTTFKVTAKKEEDKSITLNIREVGEDGLNFKYTKISKLISINKDLDMLEIKNIIESKLKEFVMDIIIKNNINIVNNNETIPTYMGNFEENKDTIQPIDFKVLLEREEDKKKVIYGLYDSILETNSPVIQKVVGSDYGVEIQYNKSKANILSISDYNSGRCCYIKYENVNPHKCFGYTKEEIESYLQRIVVAFIMECDK